MFYGLWAVEIVLTDLTGSPSVAVCCDKLRKKCFGGGVLLGRVVRTGSGVGNISLRPEGIPPSARREHLPPSGTRCAFSSGQRVCSAAACIKNTVHIKKVLQTAKRCGKYFARCVCKMI